MCFVFLLGVVRKGGGNDWHHASDHYGPKPDNVLQMVIEVEQHIPITRSDFELLQRACIGSCSLEEIAV